MDQTATSTRKSKDDCNSLGSQRVYKKTSANSVLTLYLGSRELISKRGVVEPLKGVIYIDPKFMSSQKIYGQLTLTFRYGREDEEVMGLKFCNEAVIALKQIWPRVNYDDDDVTPLQQALIARLGKGSHPFTLEIGMLAPPSVQLIPAKKYNGAPIGTSYDVRVFMSDLTDEKLQRRTTVKLGIRLTHKIPTDLRAIQQTNPTFTSLPKSIRLRLSPKQLKLHHHKHQQGTTSKSAPTIGFTADYASHSTAVVNVDSHPLTLSTENQPILNEEANGTKLTSNTAVPKGPVGCVDKPFLWTEGRVSLKASLSKSAYSHGEGIFVSVDINNKSRKVIRKIRVFAVQHVDVCMFSNGKFKNVVADVNESPQIKPNETYTHIYEIMPVKGSTKNWIAVEGTFSNYNSPTDPESPTSDIYKIASSAHRGPPATKDRNVFAIYVSYYVKVKLTLSSMGGEVSLKLPFILGHVDSDDDDEPNVKMASNKNNAKIQTTNHQHRDNIIEEELHEDHDTLSLLNDDNDGKQSKSDDKYIRDKTLLQRYKLKRSSYSRSCEDIDTCVKEEEPIVNAVKVLVHREANYSND